MGDQEFGQQVLLLPAKANFRVSSYCCLSLHGSTVSHMVGPLSVNSWPMSRKQPTIVAVVECHVVCTRYNITTQYAQQTIVSAHFLRE